MSDFDRLVQGLQQAGAYPHPVARVEHIETHISHVLLAGAYAYKLKKPLNLGFLDFSTLERRRFCCWEELRLNRRLAPHIYLDVVPITGTPDAPAVGGEGEALEYAVKMRRFSQDALLTRLPVTPELADRIAERVAGFHDAIPAAPEDSPFGTPEAVRAPMQENFAQIRSRLRDRAALARLRPLEGWTDARLAALRRTVERRKREGRIRECHGDMHRGNIALVDGELVIFDGIEFNPGLRWIDTMSEVAFLVMDLEEAGEEAPARRLLNRYLEISGDYDGLLLLDLYKVYRAMVRAKVTAIRLGQSDVDAQEAARDRADFERYVALAEGYTRPRPKRLLITHGVSGSGKSRLAAVLRERLPLIHVRSDVERKRLFWLPADARTDSGKDAGIYAPEAGARTYARLADLASLILEAGYSPLVDATFLRAAQRRPFLELATEKGCPCTILAMEAPQAVLRERVASRMMEGRDASEADLAILDAQMASKEPLTAAERQLAVVIDTHRPGALEGLLRTLYRDAASVLMR
ncbi:MAG: AAA family ATPase [Pseudomonadota bacterium]|nr:AAA family ATPase [Pseudomonadota bacterium]